MSEPKSLDKIIPVNESITLRSWKVEEATMMFSIIDSDRDYLERQLDWVKNCKSTADSP